MLIATQIGYFGCTVRETTTKEGGDREAEDPEDMATSDADQMWNTLARSIKDAEKDSVGVTSESTRTHSIHKESWWFYEEV
ncbi:hypothetical protein Tco_0930219 [Tanacetum coccineum]